MKDLNWLEKLGYTAAGWHYGCRIMQPRVLRLLLYPMGLVCVPLGALTLPHYMCAPPGMPMPKFLQPNDKAQFREERA